jgi:hypothetical protein
MVYAHSPHYLAACLLSSHSYMEAKACFSEAAAPLEASFGLLCRDGSRFWPKSQLTLK